MYPLLTITRFEFYIYYIPYTFPFIREACKFTYISFVLVYLFWSSYDGLNSCLYAHTNCVL